MPAQTNFSCSSYTDLNVFFGWFVQYLAQWERKVNNREVAIWDHDRHVCVPHGACQGWCTISATQKTEPWIPPIMQREEQGPRWDLSSLTSPAGLKELKLFWATSAPECKPHFGKLHFSAPRGYKNIPHIFLHSCLWFSSQQCPTDQERMALARCFFHLCINELIDSWMPVPSI